MKVKLTIFLIISFIGIAVFGVLGVNHSFEYGHNGCIAATIKGTDCPQEENTVPVSIFHLDAFQKFLTVTLNDHFANALFLFIALISIAGVGIIGAVCPAPPERAIDSRYGRFLESYSFPFQRKLIYWLAFHENSPATPHRTSI